MSRNSNGINFFGPPLMAGVPIAQQQGMIDKINTLCAVLANLDGENGITLVREGKQWAIVLNASSISYGSVDAERCLPWTASIYQGGSDAWRVRFLRCGYTRGPVTRIIAPDPDFALPDPPDNGSGDYWIGVKINTETGGVDPTLLCSQTASDVYDATPPSDEFFKKLLYVLTYAAVPDTDPAEYKWTVKAGWYRLLPELGAYV